MRFAPLYALGLWFLLWFGLAIAAGYLAFLPIMLGAAILGTQTGASHTLITLAVAGVAVSGYCLLRGLRLGLLKRADLCLFATACIVVSAAVSTLIEKWSMLGPRSFWVALICFCALLPVALPFIGAPLLMNWIRHR